MAFVTALATASTISWADPRAIRLTYAQTAPLPTISLSATRMSDDLPNRLGLYKTTFCPPGRSVQMLASSVSLLHNRPGITAS